MMESIAIVEKVSTNEEASDHWLETSSSTTLSIIQLTS